MQTWFGLIFFELIHYHIAEAGYFSIMWFKDIPNIFPSDNIWSILTFVKGFPWRQNYFKVGFLRAFVKSFPNPTKQYLFTYLPSGVRVQNCGKSNFLKVFLPFLCRY